jgi:carbonic anhydrase
MSNVRSLGRAAAAVFAIALAPPAYCEGAHPHWSYQGHGAPTHWAELEPEFAACGTGREQSPIDIRVRDAVQADLPPISFDYHPVPLRLIDNGHTIQVNYGPGSFITVDGERYELQQFHFHKPSEEAIDGRHAAMVAHLVHKDSQGRLAVVAVLLDRGAINPMVASLWNNLPAKKEAEVEARDVQIDATDLLPAQRSYYTFTGSLTTPPCSEGVKWFVLKTPSTLSAGEVERFGRSYPTNARPVQALNGRTIRASN